MCASLAVVLFRESLDVSQQPDTVSNSAMEQSRGAMFRLVGESILVLLGARKIKITTLGVTRLFVE